MKGDAIEDRFSYGEYIGKNRVLRMGKNTMLMQNPNHNRTDLFYRFAAVHLMDFCHDFD